MNQNMVPFIQIQTLPPPQVETYYWFCVQNNQWEILRHHLLTKSPIEFKVNSTLRNSQPQKLSSKAHVGACQGS